MVPGVLRATGDIPHLAALLAPRRLVVAGAVTGGGKPLAADELAAAFAFTRQMYLQENVPAALSILPAASAARIAQEVGEAADRGTNPSGPEMPRRAMPEKPNP
jgi:hypothetical protein